jgi:hypothetical protein
MQVKQRTDRVWGPPSLNPMGTKYHSSLFNHRNRIKWKRKLWSSSLYNSLNSPVTSTFLGEKLYYLLLSYFLPVSIAARSKVSTVFGRSITGIAGSNLARGMDVCLCFSVLCCPVQVKALRWTDPPPKESYQMSNGSISKKKFRRPEKA